MVKTNPAMWLPMIAVAALLALPHW
jgi:hypothetical protein